MQIIHLSGTQCSGKSYVSKPFLEHPDVAGWDLLEFYNYNKVLPGGMMDWDKWEEIRDQIVPELDQFLKDNKDKKVCIVESGSNGAIHKYLHDTLSEDIVEIQLKTPANDTLIMRSKERDLDFERVLDFKYMFLRRHSHNSINQFTQEEASLILKAYIEGIRVAIIGTAGRKEDGPKMSKELYFKMCRKAINIIDKLQLKPKCIQLVSGGAAWADHIAISLYLDNNADKLRLHLPCGFHKEENNSHYIASTKDTKTPDAANYYHIEFSQKMKGDTLDGISKTISKGAEVIVTPGFKPRDLKIAEDSDLMIAFTWNEGREPKAKSGTLYTWSHSDATVKIHVPLSELEGVKP